MPMNQGAGRSSMDHKKPWNSRGQGSMGHKSNPSELPSGRNQGQKMASEVPHDYSPAPGSPEPTQGR